MLPLPLLQGRPSDDHRCSFRHIPANLTRSSHQDNQYTKIQSVANPEWYIGFKKDAKPMRGYEHGRRREKCFMFELTRATPFTFDFSNRLMSDSPAQSETDSIPSQTHPHRHHKGETHSGRKVQSQASIDVLRWPEWSWTECHSTYYNLNHASNPTRASTSRTEAL